MTARFNFELSFFAIGLPNGERYPQVGGLGYGLGAEKT